MNSEGAEKRDRGKSASRGLALMRLKLSQLNSL